MYYPGTSANVSLYNEEKKEAIYYTSSTKHSTSINLKSVEDKEEIYSSSLILLWKKNCYDAYRNIEWIFLFYFLLNSINNSASKLVKNRF